MILVAAVARRVRAGLLGCALFAAVGMLAACGGSGSGTQSGDPCAAVANTGTAIPSASGHLVYQRSAVGPLPARTTWQSGAALTFQWCATPSVPTHDIGDAQELLGLILIGPFASRADAQTAAGQPVSQSTPVATAQPVTTDLWSATRFTSSLDLPTNVISGFYVIFATVQVGNSTGQGTNGAPSPTSSQSFIIQVAA